MNRIQLACYAMIASACVLAGLLIVQIDKHAGLGSAATAEMVSQQGNVTYLTARIRNDEEGLFILDGSKHQLAIYRTDITRKKLELVHRQDLNRLFSGSKQKKAGRSKKSKRIR